MTVAPGPPTGAPAHTPLGARPLDAVLVACFALFAFTSLVYEPYVVLGVDLDAARDPIGRSWAWYARSFDPVFLATPLWLRIMCAIDWLVFGPFYLIAIWALVRCRPWIRTPGLVYVAAIVYSTVVYFAWELLEPTNRARANLPMVVLVNVPYTIVPLLFGWRLRHADPFGVRPTTAAKSHPGIPGR